MENKIKTKQPFARSRLVSCLLAFWELGNRNNEQAIMFPQNLSFKLLVRFIGVNDGLSCFSEWGTGFVWAKRSFSGGSSGIRALPLGVGMSGWHQAAGGLQSSHPWLLGNWVHSKDQLWAPKARTYCALSRGSCPFLHLSPACSSLPCFPYCQSSGRGCTVETSS